MENTPDHTSSYRFGPAALPVHFVPESNLDPPKPPSAAGPAGNNMGRLTFLAICFALVAGGPYLLGRFIYQVNFNQQKAGYDLATGALAELKPRLNDLELASRLVAKRVEPSVVSIIRPSEDMLHGQGSGVIVDQAGYIVTNFHVVNGVDNVEVRLSDGRHAKADVVGYDPTTDLAVLKIDLPNLIAAEWGNSDKLEVGDLVWALGSPYGLDRSLTFGIVSAKSRRSGSNVTSNLYQEYLQTDAAVNPGNSGGPLVNIEGQIVGINAAIFGRGYQGISFAIPSSLAHEQYAKLRATGKIERAWLGILPLEVPDSVREELGLELGKGVFVGKVQSGAPANRAGLKYGDVILKWNDHTATDPTLLSRAIASTEIGSNAKVVLARRNSTTGTSQQVALDVHVERKPAE
jgi:S1-C subfamily serine protease